MERSALEIFLMMRQCAYAGCATFEIKKILLGHRIGSASLVALLKTQGTWR